MFGQEALTFLQELGHRLRVKTGEPRPHHHLLQRIAVAMQRGNTAAVLGTMTVPTNDFDNAYTYSWMTRCMCAHAFACANPVFLVFLLSMHFNLKKASNYIIKFHVEAPRDLQFQEKWIKTQHYKHIWWKWWMSDTARWHDRLRTTFLHRGGSFIPRTMNIAEEQKRTQTNNSRGPLAEGLTMKYIYIHTYILFQCL